MARKLNNMGLLDSTIKAQAIEAAKWPSESSKNDVTEAEKKVSANASKTEERGSGVLRISESLISIGVSRDYVQEEYLGRTVHKHYGKVTTSDIKVWEGNPRNFARTNLEALTKSIIKTQGNIQPVLVTEFSAGTLELIYGFRRFSVCKELGLPINILYIPDLSEAECEILTEQENKGIEPIDDVANCRWFLSLFNKAKEKNQEISIRIFAERHDKKKSTMADMLRIGGIPESIYTLPTKPTPWLLKHGKAVVDILKEVEPDVVNDFVSSFKGKLGKPSDVVDALTASFGVEVKRETREPQSFAVGGGNVVLTEQKTGALTVKFDDKISSKYESKILDFIKTL